MLLAAAVITACGSGARHAAASASSGAAPTFVGAAACGECHKAESAAWRGSFHDRAMQEATDATVLGNFDGATFNDGTVTSRFFRRDGGFFVNTDGPDGRLADFAIRYTFGVYPLQQYLIAFPDGRLQALGIAWDARRKEDGGQRWFHLYPDKPPRAGDPLHWTGLEQTWNFQCAECHSTELRKNYDAARNTYATTWAEINVACEACHGPGSAHVAWARGARDTATTGSTPASDNGLLVHFNERQDVQWLPDPATGTARRSVPHRSAAELETCGVCHSLSTKIAEPWRPGHPLLDSHLPSLLVPGRFEADGKNLGEVYNYAAFRQSRMFSRGVTCSDCHDPHSLKLRADGNAVCEQCHNPGTFATAAHTHHAEGSPAGRCVACHMPARTFMGVDRRHDHGFRIPRPDESVRFGTSNACNDCHTDKDAAWAAAAIEKWFGPQRKGFQTWTATLAAARNDTGTAAAALTRLAADPNTPSIVRATAFDALSSSAPGPATANAVQAGTADADPLVRWSALHALAALPDAQSRPLAAARLADPVLGVRIEAARQLAAVPRAGLAEADRARLDKATAELIEALRINADRPEGRVNLGHVYALQGRLPEAIAEFAAARALDPGFTPAYVDGAQVLAQQGREADAERLLREGLERTPADALLNHAVGLSLIRQRRGPEALGFLGRAAETDPSSPRFAFVYAVGLNALGRQDAALEVLGASQARHPGDADTLLALATINRDAGRRAAALEWARKLAAVDPRGRSLVDELSQPPPR